MPSNNAHPSHISQSSLLSSVSSLHTDDHPAPNEPTSLGSLHPQPGSTPHDDPAPVVQRPYLIPVHSDPALDPAPDPDASAPQDLDEGFASDGLSPSPPLAPADAPAQPALAPSVVGHVRAPVLAREPTTLESLSRTLCNYVPSAIPIPIPIPAAGPIPSRVSRPVSFGSSHTTTPSPYVPHQSHQSHARRVSEVPRPTWEREREHTPVFNLDEEVRERARYPGLTAAEDARGAEGPARGAETVVWAGWDSLAVDEGVDGVEKARRLLLLGYASGVQIWDCTDLGAVSEMVNLSKGWGAVTSAGVLPSPRPPPKPKPEAAAEVTDDDPVRWSVRPLVGIVHRAETICGNAGTDTDAEFVVYSLRTHEIVKRLPVPGLRAFSASENFIVLSTSNFVNVNLHILSSSTFDTLYTIPSASLAPFAPAAPSHSRLSINNINIGNIGNVSSFMNLKNNTNSNVSHLDLEDDGSGSTGRRAHRHQQHHYSQHQQQHAHHQQHGTDPHTPHVVFAHSRRLLAFAAPLAPPHSHPVSPTSPGAPAHPPPALHTDAHPKFALGMTQAELGSAAVKLGGGVLSGMKSLGGLAISAARAGVSAAVDGAASASASGSASGSSAAGPGEGASGLSRMFFSRSAPAAGPGGARQRRVSHSVSEGGRGGSHEEEEAAAEAEAERRAYVLSASGPCCVTVVDLQPLLALGGAGKRPVVIAEFVASKRQPVGCLRFAPDGTTLVASLKDGRSAKVYQLRPTPRVLRSPCGAAPQQNDADGRQRQQQRGESAVFDLQDAQLEPPRHVYTLHRGHTGAIVEGMKCAGDGRWVALATRKRTVHVFATNPYGGPPDEASHLTGKVVNAVELQPYPTELAATVRLRAAKVSCPEHSPAPLAFTFIRSSPSTLPSNLLPATLPHYSTSSSPSSVHSTSHGSPHSLRTPRNLQDMLVFDPHDGTLSLRRVVVERSAPAPEHGLAIAGSVPVVGGASVSFPGVSSLGRLNTAPTGSGSPRKAPGVSQTMEKPAELAARESTVGTWVLKRGRGWPEVKNVLTVRTGERKVDRPVNPDWLSRAELSTFSYSSRILPRSIYFSHQFSFHIFGEDYHALIRSYRFDVPAKKIDVRKAVEVSAYATDTGEAFVQGLQGPRDFHPVSSSFDEPLASAIQGELPYLNPSPPVLPMYPNGPQGSSGRSLRNTMSVRTVAGFGDTMSEGIGRLRREIGKVRSPRLAACGGQSLPESVPLEFEEDEEDFFVDAYALPPRDPAEAAQMPSAAIDMVRTISLGEDSGESLSLSTPSPNLAPLPAEDGMEGVWQGWEAQDQEAVEDAERFDDITVGFMDEEQEAMREAAMMQALGLGKKVRRSWKL